MEELLETLYSGIINVRDWDVFCKKLAITLKANSVLILSINSQINKSRYSASCGISKEFQQVLFKYLPNDDPRINLAQSNPAVVQIFNPSNNKIFSSSLIYREVFQAELIAYHLALCITIDQFEDLFIIVDRKITEPPFNDEDIAIINRLKSHIARAVKIHKKNALNEKYIRAGLHYLKHQPVGSIIADTDSRVFYLNNYAKLLLEKKDGLVIINNYIYHGNISNSKLLSDVIDLNIDGSQENLTTLSRNSSAKPYLVNIKPFKTRRTPFQSQYQCKNMTNIFIIDPDIELNSSIKVLKKIFGLTTSEAKVASSLTKSCHLKNTELELHITVNTAKTHLKNIFRKMNVNNQIELVKLITTSYLWTSTK